MGEIKTTIEKCPQERAGTRAPGRVVGQSDGMQRRVAVGAPKVLVVARRLNFFQERRVHGRDKFRRAPGVEFGAGFAQDAFGVSLFGTR